MVSLGRFLESVRVVWRHGSARLPYTVAMVSGGREVVLARTRYLSEALVLWDALKLQIAAGDPVEGATLYTRGVPMKVIAVAAAQEVA